MTDTTRLMAAIDRLLLPFPALGSERAEELLRLYVAAAQDSDIRDIEAGVDRLLTGRHPGYDGRFAPTPPQLGNAILRCMHDRLDRENRMRAAKPRLPAPDVPKDDESRKRVLAKAAAAAEMLEEVTHAMSSSSEADRRRFAERVAARFDPDPNGYATQERLLRRWVVGDAEANEDAA